VYAAPRFGRLQEEAIIDLLPPAEWDQIEVTINKRSLPQFRRDVAYLVWKRLRPRRSREEAKRRQKWVAARRKRLQRTIAELKVDTDEGFLVLASGLEAALHRFEEMHVDRREPNYDNHAAYSALGKLFKFYTDNDPGYTEDRYYREQDFSGPFLDLVTFFDKLIATPTAKAPKANQTIGTEIVKPVVRYKDKLLSDPY
jgi:hypothetical protein